MEDAQDVCDDFKGGLRFRIQLSLGYDTGGCCA